MYISEKNSPMMTQKYYNSKLVLCYLSTFSIYHKKEMRKEGIFGIFKYKRDDKGDIVL
jgi:hypothetical protein